MGKHPDVRRRRGRPRGHKTLHQQARPRGSCWKLIQPSAEWTARQLVKLAVELIMRRLPPACNYPRFA